MSDRGCLDGGSLDLRDVVEAGTNLDHTRACLRVLDPVPKLTDELLRQGVDICGARQPGCMKVLVAAGNSEQMDRNPARDVDQSLDVSTVIAGGTLDQRATVHRDERLDLVLGPRLVIETRIRIVFRNRNRVAQEMDMVETHAKLDRVNRPKQGHHMRPVGGHACLDVPGVFWLERLAGLQPVVGVLI